MDRYSFLMGKRPFSYGIHIFVDVSDLRHGRFFGTYLFVVEGVSVDDAGRGVYAMHLFSRIPIRVGFAKGGRALSMEL